MIEKIKVISKGILSFISLLIVTQFYTLLIFIPIPLSKSNRKLFYKKKLKWLAKFVLKSHLNIKTNFLNPYSENFTKPAVIIANHQTLLDAITTYSLTHKIVLITTDWLKNIFYRIFISKYLDNITVTDGNEAMMIRSKEMLDKGNFLLVFPEGDRKKKPEVSRFHKGAFLMAAFLKVDILPIVIFGSNDIHSGKWFYFKKGTVLVHIGKRIPHCDSTNNDEIRLQAKRVTAEFRKIYSKLQAGEVPQ